MFQYNNKAINFVAVGQIQDAVNNDTTREYQTEADNKFRNTSESELQKDHNEQNESPIKFVEFVDKLRTSRNGAQSVPESLLHHHSSLHDEIKSDMQKSWENLIYLKSVDEDIYERVRIQNGVAGFRRQLAWFQDQRYLPEQQAGYLKKLAQMRETLLTKDSKTERKTIETQENLSNRIQHGFLGSVTSFATSDSEFNVGDTARHNEKGCRKSKVRRLPKGEKNGLLFSQDLRVNTSSLPTIAVHQQNAESQPDRSQTPMGISTQLTTISATQLTASSSEISRTSLPKLFTPSNGFHNSTRSLTSSDVDKLIESQITSLVNLRTSRHSPFQNNLGQKRNRFTGEQTKLPDNGGKPFLHHKDKRGVYRGPNREDPRVQQFLRNKTDQESLILPKHKPKDKRYFDPRTIKRPLKHNSQIHCPPPSPSNQENRVTTNVPGFTSQNILPTRHSTECIFCRHPELMPFNLEPSEFFHLPNYDENERIKNTTPDNDKDVMTCESHRNSAGGLRTDSVNGNTNETKSDENSSRLKVSSDISRTPPPVSTHGTSDSLTELSSAECASKYQQKLVIEIPTGLSLPTIVLNRS